MKVNKLFKVLASGVILAPTICLITSCGEGKKDIAILYTNDTHSVFENSTTKLGFINLAGYRNNLEAKGVKTILVDSGDIVQGSSYGTIGQGKYQVDIFNACKYDVITPGNHEFDYNMERFFEVKNSLNASMISSNFYRCDPTTHKPTTRVLDDCKIIERGGRKIGFVGISTPDTITSSNPKHFKDDDGNFIYTFLNDNDPTNYYLTIQNSINYLKDQKCDFVFGLGHLGPGDETTPYCSKEIIKHTYGLNGLFDGHSHTYMPKEIVKDSNGNDVFLTQTGTQFESFGSFTIKSNNQFELQMIKQTDLTDTDVAKVVNKSKGEIEAILNQQIGTLDFTLRIDDGADEPKRIVRNKECNAGDFYVDALAYGAKNQQEQKPPVTVVNGGAIRKNINKGTVTFGNIVDIAPFGNQLCRIKTKGQTILDALEFSVFLAPKEFGGFLQVSSRLHYEADLSIDTPVVVTTGNTFVEIKQGQPRRITKATIDNVDIVPTQEYELAGTSYILIDGGNGYTMFKNSQTTECPSSIDTNALNEYFKYCSDNNLFEQYRDVQNRIVLTNE